MLFVQSITIGYYKNMRFPQYANEREKIIFLPIELNPNKFLGAEPLKENMLDCEVLVQYENFWQYPMKLHSYGTKLQQFGDEILGSSDDGSIQGTLSNIRLFKDEADYRVAFCDDGSFLCHSKRKGHNEEYTVPHTPFANKNKINKTVFRLSDGDYGRIIYNNRYIDHDTGKWIYTRNVYNIVCCNKAAFREKMFYRKKPDFEYTNLLYLR